MVPQLLEKIKAFASDHKNALFGSLFVVLLGLASFGLGRFSAVLPKKEPLVLEEHAFAVPSPASPASSTVTTTTTATAPSPPKAEEKIYVASKSGKAYYFVWCSAAARIKEENKILFASKTEAEGAGYHAAANCPGMK